jgi:hypothetical protein
MIDRELWRAATLLWANGLASGGLASMRSAVAWADEWACAQAVALAGEESAWGRRW